MMEQTADNKTGAGNGRDLKMMLSNLRARLASPRFWSFFLCLAAIAVISLAFFYPDAIEGNELRQHDMQQGAAIGQEVKQFAETHDGHQARWTNSLFSGMPNFQISPSYPSDKLFGWINTLYGGFLPSPANLLFMMMAGFLILMYALRARWYYAILGAVAWGFSSYFVIIIGAGHIWKFVTLAYIPPTIGGIMMVYNGRRLAGSAIAALFAMMQIHNNHIQMSYYFLIVVAALVIAYLVSAIREKRVARWCATTGILAGAALLAVAANLPNLYHTYRYAHESMRGSHSELTDTQADASEKTSGLDRDYITQYSYGRSETFSLLIPNIKGGASVLPADGGLRPSSLADLDNAQDVMNELGLNEIEQQYVGSYAGQYFGEPEGTNGPVYVGAIVFALFLVGCFVVRGPVKWALLIATLLSLGLALGRNMQWLTDLFIDHVPMYARFRTVESILVVAEFTMPLLAVLGLKEVFSAPDSWKRYGKTVMGCFGAVALLCIVGWLAPAVYGKGITQGDIELSSMISYQLSQGGYPAEAVNMFSINNPSVAAAVERLRFSMVSADSLRSLMFVAAGLFVMLIVMRRKANVWVGTVLMGAWVLMDLYNVDKRYLNGESFSEPSQVVAEQFPLTAADRAILQDTAMNYRVMDIPRFYQAAPSFHHKAIGGYHAAKLTRYQDLISRHLGNFAQGNPDAADYAVLDMLNARYLITPDGNPVYNEQAMGNAWFVDRVDYVDGADAEMDALSRIDLRRSAVADSRFKALLGTSSPVAAGDTIFETSYAPDRLTYSAKSANGGVAVFSEVYFPWGWKATIDGKPAEIGRVNYLLRAVRVPAGSHTIELAFDPDSVKTTVAVADVAVIAIYLLLLAAAVAAVCSPLKKEDDEPTSIGK